MKEREPFVIDDFEKWEKVLYQCRIPLSTWTNMKHLYENYAAEFDPNIIRYSDDIQFCETTKSFFHFSKVTIKGCKTEFIAWLKEHWEIFNGPTFMVICSNCITVLQDFNRENPNAQRPFVNWIPLYGGLIREPEHFPNENQLHYMERFHVPFPLEPQIPLTEEEQEQIQRDVDDFLNPDDVASGL
jgi:hypothetical protein